jgi:hypothetical protein
VRTVPGPGDKVLTLEDRLTSLERQMKLLIGVNVALVAVHVQELAPFAQWVRSGLAAVRAAAGLA